MSGDLLKVVLLNPPQPVSFFPKIPPLGIAYLGALLREKGHDVILYDLNVRLGRTITQDDISILVRKILAEEPGIVGISCWAMCMPFVSEFVEAYKREDEGLLVLGGPYPSLAPAQTLENIQTDACVKGEGELPLLDMAEHPEKLNELENVWSRNGEKIIQNRSRTEYYPLDDLPYPAFDLLPPIEEYQNVRDDYWYMEYPKYEFPIIGSRGCTYKCAFCSTRKIWTKYRRRNPEKIVGDIVRLTREYGDIFVDFQDDMFTLHREWVKSICTKLMDVHADVTWSCCTRVDCVDEELLTLMKASGCTNIDLGIESINDDVLQYIHKGYTAQDVERGLAAIIEHGINAETTYIVNFPIETKEDILKTVCFGEKTLQEGVSEVTFYLLTPYPGIDLIAEHKVEVMPSPYRKNLLNYVSHFSSTPEKYSTPFWLPEAFTVDNPHLSDEDFWEIFERIHEINERYPAYPLSFYREEEKA